MSLNNIFIFLFLVFFPFGQLLKVGPFLFIDGVVLLATVYVFAKKIKPPTNFKFLRDFLIFCFASWLFSLLIFNDKAVFYGLLYLVRLIGYFYFYIYVKDYLRTQKNKQTLLNGILAVSLVSALFGWIQFFIFPDLKPIFVWNWDMHLYRLSGLILDPAFLSLIIVFGIVISLFTYINSRKYIYILLTLFLIVSLAFTYSRAGYLAFFAALAVFLYKTKNVKKVAVLGFLLAAMLFILPTKLNQSNKLTRMFSVVSRVETYGDAYTIFKKSPVIGVGYNNYCLAYRTYIGFQDFKSHACSGSNSSLLNILATTGVLGLMIFVINCILLVRGLNKNREFYIFMACALALVVHSLFNNSLFYPFTLGILMLLLAEV